MLYATALPGFTKDLRKCQQCHVQFEADYGDELLVTWERALGSADTVTTWWADHPEQRLVHADAYGDKCPLWKLPKVAVSHVASAARQEEMTAKLTDLFAPKEPPPFGD
ncbi:hypothetical protein OG548_16735 [Streptomyces sp. NBC_01356]|uniref:hypothetical protein n=1 Tax=Streptomyces sp. NBC_01356 TaxID=2903836 RepID=UPI002E3255AF|nr:hypothetical protein [Streptomyces sp. NBC_01356]